MKSINKIFASGMLIKNFLSESFTLEKVTDVLEVNKERKGSFYIYVQARVIGNEKYHLFVILKNESKMRFIGDFTIPDNEEELIDNDLIQYRMLFNMADFYFPELGIYEIYIYGIKESDYFKEQLDVKEGQEVYSFLNIDSETNILDRFIFHVK